MREIPTNAAALRQWLADRSPAPRRSAGHRLPTGLPVLDDVLGGGLAGAAITELVSEAPSSGGTSLLAGLLETARAGRLRVALIDAADAFDPVSFAPELLAPLVWARCSRERGVAEAMQAADFLVRDANFGLVLLDLRGCPAADLRRVPATAWYRLQRAAEQTAAPVVVQTGRALVPSAAQRVAFTRSFGLADVECPPRRDLAARVAAAAQRQRWSGTVEAAG